ncbi:restriction endonuclease subunit S [Accumulibacter sp.]|uniref:restriction endonuclease subunit S n=1 Tax=Accumulibacter sp. TaxID=2053492 RepID=UPI0035B0E7BD
MIRETGAHYPLSLGPLPAGWRAGYVGDFAKDIEPGFASGEHNQMGTGIPHLRPMNVDRDGKIDLSIVKFVAADKDRRRLASGDVLFNNTNSPELVGKTAVVNQNSNFAFSNHMTRIRFAEDVLPKFGALQLYFLWMRGYFRYNCVKHVNQASISSKTLARAVPFIWAPVDQQERIVAEIEKQFSRLDEAVANLKRVKANLKRYTSSVLRAVTDGQFHSEEANTALEYESNSWRRLTIEELASREPRSIQSGPFGSNLLHSAFQSTGKLVIGIDNVQDGEFSVGSNHRISESKFTELGKYTARPKDVLITVMATVGRVCVLPDSIEPAIITKHVYRISVDQSVAVPEYVGIALRGAKDVRAQLRESIRGQTRPGLNGNLIRRIRVPVPPLAEQHRIIAEVDRRLSIVREVESEVDANLKRAQVLRQAVLARAFAPPGATCAGQSEHVVATA